VSGGTYDDSEGFQSGKNIAPGTVLHPEKSRQDAVREKIRRKIQCAHSAILEKDADPFRGIAGESTVADEIEAFL